MLKEMKKRVMQIANRLVGQGYIRACAMETAWKLVKAQAVSTRVVGTTFENRQNVLALLASYHPAEISVQLVRENSNPFDSNAVAVTAAVKGKVRAVIGYLPKAVASVIAALMDKGLAVLSDVAVYSVLLSLQLKTFAVLIISYWHGAVNRTGDFYE